MLKHLDLFSGIGGFSLAAQMVGGISTNQFVEIDSNCQRILTKNFPGVPIHGDIRTFTTRTGDFNLITGGFPCQDNSTANQKGRGLNGERSGLWFEMLRVIRDSSPEYVVVENVPPTCNRRWDVTVRAGLEGVGYKVFGLPISAAEVGANHLRKRLFIVAYSNSLGIDSTKNAFILSCKVSHQEKSTWWEGCCELRRGNSGRVFLLPRSWACRVDDGIPSRMDRMNLHALGNAVVPQVAAIVLRRVLKLDQRRKVP